MRIGIFDPYLDDLGGGEKYMMIIAQCLAKKHNVSVFWDNKEDIKVLQERFLLDLSAIVRRKNIFSSKVSVWERLLATRQYDVIIILSDGSIPSVLSKKLFLHFQQPMEHVSSLSWKTRIKLKKVNGIFCNSEFTKKYIEKTFDIQARVIYPPVEFHPKKVDKENMILHVGRLRVRDVTVEGKPIIDFKKQSVMIAAFKEMVQEGLKNWRFVLAVSVKEEDREALKEIQKTAQGFPIEFVVNKNNRLLWELYNRAKIYWHATGFGEDLEKHPEFAEHFGMSTVEAMGAGAVPVVINAGGQREIVTDNKDGFFWDTLLELKEKTHLLIQDTKLLDRMSKAARAKTKHFDKERFFKEIYEVVEN